MPMTIYAKIGTHPQTCVHVKYKRKLPVVGEMISIRNIKEIGDQRVNKWTRVIVTEVRDLGDYLLYFVSL